jgi:hypothetical protein
VRKSFHERGRPSSVWAGTAAHAAHTHTHTHAHAQCTLPLSHTPNHVCTCGDRSSVPSPSMIHMGSMTKRLTSSVKPMDARTVATALRACVRACVRACESMWMCSRARERSRPPCVRACVRVNVARALARAGFGSHARETQFPRSTTMMLVSIWMRARARERGRERADVGKRCHKGTHSPTHGGGGGHHRCSPRDRCVDACDEDGAQHHLHCKVVAGRRAAPARCGAVQGCIIRHTIHTAYAIGSYAIRSSQGDFPTV